MKTRIVQKVFVFLLLTVGITFMLWRIAGTREPFLNMSSGLYTQFDFNRAENACSKTTIGQTPVYMCPDVDKAEQLLRYQDSLEDSMRPTNQRLLDTNAAICFPSGNQTTIKDGASYYTCYSRPPPIVYDQNQQKDRYLNPEIDGDPIIFTLDATYPLACSAYQAATTMAVRSFSTTQTNVNLVGTTITTIQNAYSTLGTIYTQRCATTQTGNKGAACASMKVFFDGLQGNTTVSGLQTTYSTIWQAASTMKGTYRNDILPNFASLNCRDPTLALPAGL